MGGHLRSLRVTRLLASCPSPGPPTAGGRYPRTPGWNRHRLLSPDEHAPCPFWGLSAPTLSTGLAALLDVGMNSILPASGLNIDSAVILLQNALIKLLDVRLAVVGLALLLARRILDVRSDLARIGFFPGLRVAMNPLFPYPLLPRLPYFCMEGQWWNRLKHEPFAKAGTDVLSAACLFPARVSYIIADPVTLKEVLRDRKSFAKPTELMKSLNILGVNIVTAEGAEYRRHRIPVQGSFSERNNRLVWDTSSAIVQDLLNSSSWRGQDVVHVNDIREMTVPLALHVLSSAVFGQPIASHQTTREIAPGRTMPFEEALGVATDELVTLVLVPKWLRRMVAPWRRVDDALNDIVGTVRDLIARRRQEHVAGLFQDRADILSSLIYAVDSEDQATKLTDEELVADLVVFVVAGHETAAHAIAFALALLALHPEEQQRVYEEVQIYSEGGHPPRYEDMSKLSRCLAVVHETLRLYPPSPRQAKRSNVDTTLPLAFPTPDGRNSIVVPKGTLITTHVPALHHNPRYWSHPHLFRPARFLDPTRPWNRDAFMPFAGGPRMCIGRRFGETECVSVLATLLSAWTVELGDKAKDALQSAGMMEEAYMGEKRRRMMDDDWMEGVTAASEAYERARRRLTISLKQGLTLTPIDLGLVFKRRAC